MIEHAPSEIASFAAVAPWVGQKSLLPRGPAQAGRCAFRASCRPRTLLLVLLLILSFWQIGCVEKPTMKLHHADVAGLAVSLPPNVGVLLQIHVDVHNPNSYDVAVRAVRGQVVLAGRHTVPVNFTAAGEGLWLDSDKTTRVIVPVEVPMTTSLAVLNESVLATVVPYHFTGRADVTATRSFKLEKDDYSVSENGVISREQIQAGLHVSR